MVQPGPTEIEAGDNPEERQYAEHKWLKKGKAVQTTFLEQRRARRRALCSEAVARLP